MTEKNIKFTLRMGSAFHSKIKQLAERENVSLNEYLETTLRNALDSDGDASPSGFCSMCRRQTEYALFDGCANEDCPHGHSICF